MTKKKTIKQKSETKKALKPVAKKRALRSAGTFSEKSLKEQIRDLIVKGRKAFDAGDYDQALPLLKRVNDLDGNFPDILNMLGLIYHAKGQFSKALQAFEEALTINPN